MAKQQWCYQGPCAREQGQGQRLGTEDKDEDMDLKPRTKPKTWDLVWGQGQKTQGQNQLHPKGPTTTTHYHHHHHHLFNKTDW